MCGRTSPSTARPCDPGIALKTIRGRRITPKIERPIGGPKVGRRGGPKAGQTAHT